MYDHRLADPPRTTEAAGSPAGPPGRAPRLFASMCTGQLLALLDNGRTPLVQFDDGASPQPRKAATLVDLQACHVGRQVVLYVPDDGDHQPIVMGVVVADGSQSLPDIGEAAQLSADGKRLVVTATHELVLRCGKASLTLHKDGRIDICGEAILTRATGANRVQGGSVQLN
jgi:hypothetical protein